jgi:undecaprenyl-diphosphatase
LVGIAQGTAITPGISRSGSTISVALLCGLRRKWAAQFSFLIFVPAVLAATAFKFGEAFLGGNVESSGAVPIESIGPTITGAVIAMLSGYIALKLLLVVVEKAKLHYFSFYCWAAGIVTLLVVN